ncbi:MAG TPA: hypothetical protein VK559_07845 [Ferruginibacter sp.]|nr:hypothetical protein [Ferruginibacter sp.]
MKRSTFLMISGIGALIFGGMMFFVPAVAANSLGMEFSPTTGSVLRGMGGLIIGTGLMNFLFAKINNLATVMVVLMTNIATHAFGLAVDLFGIHDGVLTITKMAPVEITHLFVGVGSLIYLLNYKPTE